MAQREVFSLTQYLWKRDANLENIMESEIKVLSCDLFDTLIFRTTETPADIFRHVGEEALEKRLLKLGVLPEEFKQIRIFAEQEARKKKEKIDGCGEVNIFEIYQELPDSIGQRDELLKLELATEKRCLYINPSILSLIEYFYERQVPVVLLSDMYLLPTQVEELLTSIGFNCGLLKEIIISNQYHTNKASGGLYQILLDKFPHVLPREITHIGDNFISDVRNAQKYGIRSVYYKTKDEHGSIYEMERFSKKARVPELLSLRKLAGSLSANYRQEDRFWFEFGAIIIGPLLSVFSEWVVDIAIEEKIPKIYPLMREGGILSKFIKNSLQERGINDIEVRPLYISRRSSYLPSLAYMDEDDIKKTILNQKVKTVFTRFKIKNVFEEYGDMIILKDNSTVLSSGKTIYETVCDYLFSKENMAKIKESIRLENEVFVEYLTKEYKMNEFPFLTVDIGYNGTMQSVIDEILQHTNHSYRSIHLIALAFNKVLLKKLQGSDIRGFISESILGEPIVTDNWTPGIIEVLMMECIGSTILYKKSDSGKIIPVLEEVGNLNINKKEREYCREGMLCFQSLFLKLLREKPWLKEELYDKRVGLYGIISRFMEYPTWAEAQNLGTLNHENFFGGENFNCFCPEHLCEDAKLKGPEEFLKRRLSGDIWMAGIVEKAFHHYHLMKLMDQTNQNSNFRMMLELAKLIQRNNIRQIIVYGAGEMGKELVKILKMMNIEIVAIVDQNEKLWGLNIEDVEIHPVDKILDFGVKNIAIASYAFRKDIRQNLERKCKNKGVKCNIYDLSFL